MANSKSKTYRQAKNVASLYLRMSVESDEKGTGLESQEAELRQLAAQHGLRVLEPPHVDDGYSGALRDNPGFLAWLDDARKGRADTLLAYHVDRISRAGHSAMAEVMDVRDGVDRRGKSISPPVRLLLPGIDSTQPGSDMLIMMLSGMAKGERDRISARQIASRAARKAQGRFGGGTLPFGFRSVDGPNGRILEPVAEEVEALKEAARILTTDGLKPAARWMNLHSGIRPRRAADWTRQSLQGALQSEAASTLFTAAERQMIRDALTPKEVKEYKGRAPSRLLSGGIAVCDSCGRAMVVATRERRNGNEPSKVYKCRSVLDSAPCAHRANASAEPLETAVEEMFLAAWGDMPEMMKVRHADEHRERLAIIAEQIDQLYAQLAKAKGPERRVERAELTEQIDQLETTLAEAERVAPPASWLADHKPTGRTLGDAWRAGDVEDRRALLQEHAKTIRIAHGRPGARRFDLDRVKMGEPTAAEIDAWEPSPELVDYIAASEGADD